MLLVYDINDPFILSAHLWKFFAPYSIFFNFLNKIDPAPNPVTNYFYNI